MAQDIRKMMKQDAEEGPKLHAGHLDRFENKLDAMHAAPESDGVRSLPAANHRISWYKIAAIVLALFAVSIFGYYSLSGTDEMQNESVRFN